MNNRNFQDFKIEKKYSLLREEMDRVGEERRSIFERNEDLKKRMISVSDEFKWIEEKKMDLVREDQRIEQECESIHSQFEKLREESIKKV